MEYLLDLNPRPFEAIKNGTKKIEGRTPTEHTKDIKFENMKNGDVIVFINNETNESMRVKVLGVRHYNNVRSMLEKEGKDKVLSSRGTIEQGIESYNTLEGYREGIKKHGIYAIEVIKL